MPAKKEAPITEYHGLPIVDNRAEFRGLDGGFNKGTSVQALPTEDHVHFAGDGDLKGERFDFVRRNAQFNWVTCEASEAEGVVYIRIYKAGVAMFADAGLVGEGVRKITEEAAALAAEKAAELDRLKREAKGEFQLGAE